MTRVQGHWTLYFPLETTWQSPTLIPTREDNLSISTHTWAFVWWGSHDQKEMSYSKTSFPYSLIVRWWSHWLRRRPLLDPTSCMCTHSKTVQAREQLAKYANNVSKLLHTVCEQICYHLERNHIGKANKFGRKKCLQDSGTYFRTKQFGRKIFLSELVLLRYDSNIWLNIEKSVAMQNSKM